MNFTKKLIYNNKQLRVVMTPLLRLRRLIIEKKYLRERAVVNTISGMLIGDPIIWVKEFNGKFYVDITGDLFFRLVTEKEYEPKLVKLCLKYIDKDKDIIDIGANIGFFTVLFANTVKKGKVLSVEPTKKALSRLNKNIELNNVKDKVDIFEGVASNNNENIEIKIIEGKEEYSSIGNITHPSVVNQQWKTEKVKSIRLDELVHEKSLNPGFIKIDVEGAEHLVFQGAQKVLKTHRPIILSELNDYLLKKNGSSSKAVIDFITSCDYDIYDPINPSINPGQMDFGDIVCFPKELKIKFK